MTIELRSGAVKCLRPLNARDVVSVLLDEDNLTKVLEHLKSDVASIDDLGGLRSYVKSGRHSKRECGSDEADWAATDSSAFSGTAAELRAAAGSTD